jgi:putative ABC transport system permease protein
MFLYSAKLAIANLKNRPDLTILTIVLVGIGLALLTTMNTMSYQSSKIPLAHKSDQLRTVLLDSRDKEARNIDVIRRMPNLTYIDAENLLNAENSGVEKTYLWKTNGFLNLESGGANPRQARIMAGQSNFFSMFEIPFLYGQAWSEKDDKNIGQSIVLSNEMNQHFFGGENSVGKTIKINSLTLTVVGVLAHWTLPSRFYDRSFGTHPFDDAYLPSKLAMQLKLPRRIRCWEKDNASRRNFALADVDGLKASECNWIVMWAEVEDEASATNFKNYIDQYVTEQKIFGRFPREANNSLIKVEDYMVQSLSGFNSAFVMQLLSWLFFAVCLVNTIGILLAKYMGKVPEIALRRALGAKKKVIMTQYMLEIGFIAFLGGLLGLLLSYFGLIGMMYITIYQSDYNFTVQAIEHGYQLDWVMILQALAIAVGSTLLVSMMPVWKICNTPPAGQLKAQ